MQIILPPSETKSFGGHGEPLRLESLAFAQSPDMTAKRLELIKHLGALSAGPAAQAAKVLGLSESKAPEEISANAELLSAPTTLAISRYTGVLFDAFGYPEFTKARKEKAQEQILIGSALFGLIGAGDSIPHYRLSASTSLPNMGTLKRLWMTALPTAITELEDRFVLDLRSGGYRNLGPIPGATTVDVVTVSPSGTGKTVTHFNKHYKGILARELLHSRAQISDFRSLQRAANKAGLDIVQEGESQIALTMLVRNE